MKSAKTEILDYLQPLVMFGIFLVAVTILGVTLSVIFAVRNTPEVYVPGWVTNWGWWLLLGTLSIASVATDSWVVWRPGGFSKDIGSREGLNKVLPG